MLPRYAVEDPPVAATVPAWDPPLWRSHGGATMSFCSFWDPWGFAFEDDVGGFDELSHDGDEDEFLWLAVLFEAVGEGLEVGVAAAGGEGGDVEHAPWPAAAAGDAAGAVPGAGVAVM